jgi:hypothetical protein
MVMEKIEKYGRVGRIQGDMDLHYQSLSSFFGFDSFSASCLQGLTSFAKTIDAPYVYGPSVPATMRQN